MFVTILAHREKLAYIFGVNDFSRAITLGWQHLVFGKLVKYHCFGFVE